MMPSNPWLYIDDGDDDDDDDDYILMLVNVCFVQSSILARPNFLRHCATTGIPMFRQNYFFLSELFFFPWPLVMSEPELSKHGKKEVYTVQTMEL